MCNEEKRSVIICVVIWIVRGVLKVFHAVVVVLVSDLFEEEKNKSLWNNRDFT